jgi:hypothetical protein
MEILMQQYEKITANINGPDTATERSDRAQVLDFLPSKHEALSSNPKYHKKGPEIVSIKTRLKH